MISHRDLLYTIVHTINNTVLYTYSLKMVILCKCPYQKKNERRKLLEVMDKFRASYMVMVSWVYT